MSDDLRESPDPRFDEAARSWLELGPTSVPDRTLEAVLLAIDSTSQSRGLRAPWRIRKMTMISTTVAAAAAAIILALVSFNVPPSSMSPGASVPGEPYTWPHELASGTYSTSFIWDIPFAITFTLPEGWESRDIEVVKDPDLNLSFTMASEVFGDPCAQAQPRVVDGSIDSLADAIASLPGIDVHASREESFAGYAARYVEFTIRDDIACQLSDFGLWTLPERSIVRDRGPVGPATWGGENRNNRVWILDVAGQRLVVSALWSDDATESDLAELESVIESVRIDPFVGFVKQGDCSLRLTDPARVGVSLEAPYVVTLEPDAFELRGPYPDPFPEMPLRAQIDFQGEGWAGRPGAGLTGPEGNPDAGFATATMVNGFQGSLVFDSPGTWQVSIAGSDDECHREFPVEVLDVAQ